MPSTRIARGNEDVVLAPTTRTSFQPAPNVGTNLLPMTRVRCYNCLASAHTSATCPLRFCAQCNLYGHTRRQCTQQKSGLRKWRRDSERLKFAVDEEEDFEPTAQPPYDASDPRTCIKSLVDSLVLEEL